ncbi:PAS domain S-box protein [Pelotomaculum propionicicum]|uniref:PAS domain S-box protein n=1 Tax=Pelotomaculum propionicicum TaxID=258475 RepID=UPI003B80E7A5
MVVTALDYEQIFATSPLSILIYQDGLYRAVNPGMTRLTGYTEEELLKISFADQVHPEDRYRVVDNTRRRLAGEDVPDSYEFRAVNREGDVLFLRGFFSLIDYGGQPAILGQLIDITRQKQAEEMLEREKSSFLTIIENLPCGVVFMDKDERVIHQNVAVTEMLGYTLEDIPTAGESLLKFYRDPAYRKKVEHIWNADAKKPVKVRTFTVACKDGSSKEIEFRTTFLDDGRIVIAIFDVTERRRADEQIRVSEAKYRELADSLPELVFEMDVNGLITYANNNAYDFFCCTKDDLKKGVKGIDFIVPEEQAKAWQNILKSMRGEKLGSVEYMARRKDGYTFPIVIHSSPIIKDGRTVGLRGIIMDITERKQMEERLKVLSLRDPLTGLYNRAYFENEIERLESGGYSQASVLMCDVDGLKIINDSFGHDSGDDLLIAAADVLRSSLRDSDIIARIGGDEFAVILPNCGQVPAERAFSRILSAVEKYNAANPLIPLSLSVGFATTKRPLDLRDLYKEADNNMYREKLHQSRSTRSAVVQTLVKAMEARDFNTEDHAERLLVLVSDLGRAVDLPKQKLDDLRLLAKFHDIGKVGIPDSILFKPGPLTFSETKEMRRHCEIGHRIAQSAPDLALIADWILKHHEWWNGKGYPIGLKEEEIPLECRILAIADAYDAMTSDRPYRGALSHEEAVAELKRCAGTQFDPRLVKKFIKYLIYSR